MKRIFLLVFFIPSIACAQSAQPPQANSEPVLNRGADCLIFYPLAAFEADHEGKTNIAFDVDTDGTVQDVTIEQSSGDEELDSAARACVATRRYTSAIKTGVAVETNLRETITWLMPQRRRCDSYYPRGAAAAGLNGTTRLWFHITARGTTSDAVIRRSSGNESLDSAALSCVKTWRYRPAIEAGKPVDVPWFADIVWGQEALPDFSDKARQCVISNPPTSELLAGIDGVTELSFALVIGQMIGLRVEHSSGNTALDNLAAACVSKWRTPSNWITTETASGGPSTAYRVTVKLYWKNTPPATDKS